MTKALKKDEFSYAGFKADLMARKEGRAFLEAYADEIRAQGTTDIMGAIQSLRKTIEVQRSIARIEMVQGELREMAQSIVRMRQEIAEIEAPEDRKDNRIMAATGELDAIISATERATGDILGAAERMQEMTEDLRAAGADPQICDDMLNQVMTIFTACSFQDITGQRTTKVINVLRYLEQRVNGLMELWGKGDGSVKANLINLSDKRPDAALMSGPQLESEANDQAAIDELFAQDVSADVMPLPTAEAAAEDNADAGTPDQPEDESSQTSENDAEPMDQSDIDKMFG